MSATGVALESQYTPPEGAKTRLLTFDHLDGRTLAVVRVRTFERQLESDLGGDLSEGQKAIARRAAVLSAIVEDQESRWARGDQIDLDAYLPAVNALRRLLTELGLERKARPVNGKRGQLQPLVGR